MSGLTPSSTTSGFFQTLPTVPPQYSAPSSSLNFSSATPLPDDIILSRILAIYLPHPTPSAVTEDLHNLARQALQPSTLAHTIDADSNPPSLHLLTTFGAENKSTPLQTSPGWRALKDIQTAAGVVGHGYAQPGSSPRNGEAEWNRRIHQFASLHIWSGSAAVVTCPVAMTDGAAVLLSRHLTSPGLDSQRRAVFTESVRRLTSLDPRVAWTSGQWMTERSGGSDVRGTETVASLLTRAELEEEKRSRGGKDEDAIGLPLGPWRVDGFKWFSSATDADMVVLLAQTEKGLSAFYAPMRRLVSLASSADVVDDHDGDVATEMNGVRISRLKSKLGTRAVPTAELGISGMRAYLIGVEGQGVKEISSVLNITRLHTASSVSCWGRGLAVARAYTRVRKVKGGMLLSENAQHVRWLAQETVRYRAMSHLYFFGVALLGATECASVVKGTRAEELKLIPPEKEKMNMLMRMLTPVMKACCSLAAVEGLRACMESLGGVGYCENNEDGGVMNVARLFRDANVNPIWEGTTSVMAEDSLRVVKDKRNEGVLEKVFGAWVQGVLEACQVTFEKECKAVVARYEALRSMVKGKSSEELHWAGRVVLAHFEAIVCACLLMADAIVDKDVVSIAVAKRWVWSRVRPREDEGDWKEEALMDKRIFLGEPKQPHKEKARL